MTPGPEARSGAAAGRLSRIPFYPIAMATAYVLSVAFADDVVPAGFVRSLFWTLALVAGVSLLAVAVTRHPARGALWGFAVLLLVASREWLVQLVALLNRTFGDLAISAFGVIVVVAGALAILVVAVARRHRGRALLPVTRALNILSLALLGIVAVGAIPDVPSWFASREPSAEPAAADLPNIYLVLLDGYPRADVLLDRFGIDNSAFLSQVEEMDFRVSETSHSNYTFTLLTLTSLFEADYIPLADDRGEALTQGAVRAGFDRAALRGTAIRALRAVGYRLAASAEGFEHVSTRTAADIFMERPELTDLEMLLLRSTWLIDLPFVPSDWLIAEQRNRINGIYEDGERLALDPPDGPMLALIHVPSPHAPIVFGRDGGPVPWGSRQFGAAFAEEYGISQAAFLEAYEDQLVYLNQRALGLLRQIRTSDPGAVVMLFSDHGTASEPWSDPREQLPNLLATRMPGDPLSAEEASTPMNVMRAILGRYAGFTAPPLPDRYWVAREDDGLIVVAESTPLR